MCHKVSILVPVYGVEKCIERCAVSLFEQTYENIEYVFVNDCTPDNSINILNTVLSKYPHRYSAVKIINHSENKGLAAARNTAVAAASGEFIIHVDSDDYLSLNAIEKLIEKQIEDSSDIITPGYIVYHKNYVEKWTVSNVDTPFEMTENILARRTLVCVAGRLIRRSLYSDFSIKAIESINMGEDYSVSPLLYFYASKISTLDLFLYHYDCTNENSYTYSFSEYKCEQVWFVFDYLDAFFKNKGSKYRRSLDVARASIIVEQMKLSALAQKGESYYIKLLNRLSHINKLIFKDFALYDKILLNINNYDVLKVYVNFAFGIKKIIKKMNFAKIEKLYD